MNNVIRRISTLLLALVLVLSLSVSAFAAEVVFEGRSKGISIASDNELTASNLFGNFEGGMPGDSLSETITIKNLARDCDYIKLYIRAVPHGSGNGLSGKVADIEDSVASMQDFLSQLSMEVKQGDKTIYSGPPDELDGFQKNVYLGQYRKNQGTTLTVSLNVPIELNNEYAQRAGEVDWVFKVECYDESGKLIQTGQMNWPIPVLMTVGVLVMAAGVFLMTKKRKRNGE